MATIIKAVILVMFISSLSSVLLEISPELLDKADLMQTPIDFSLNLLKRIELSHKENSVVISPTSIYHLSLMVYLLAKNDTVQKNELRKLLQLPNDNYVINFISYAKLMHFYNSLSEIQVANKIYYDTHINPFPTLQNIFCKELEAKDFQNHLDDSIKLINEWIRSSTWERIQEKVDDKLLNRNLNLFQLNLFYFNGNWQFPFMKEYTTPGTFVDENGKNHTVDMMIQRYGYEYYWSKELESKIIKLDYDWNFSMFIILPEKNEPGVISNIINRINETVLGKMVPKEEVKEFDLVLPKFSLVNEFRYEEIFQHSKINLTSMKLRLSEKDCNLTVNEGLHVAKIVVEEVGTNNVVGSIGRNGITKAEVVKCDKPFIYLIYDWNSQAIMLEGIYRKP